MKPAQTKPQRAGAPAMELSHEIEIAAPPERVWSVLMDFASYNEWNPYQTIEGEPTLYSKVRVTSRKLRSDEITQQAQAVVTKLEPLSKLELYSGNILTWSSLRWFHLSPSPNGTVFRHGVKMSGFLAKRAFKRTHKIERLLPLFTAVSEAVARRAVSPKFRQPLKGKGNRHERRATKAKRRG